MFRNSPGLGTISVTDNITIITPSCAVDNGVQIKQKIVITQLTLCTLCMR